MDEQDTQISEMTNRINSLEANLREMTIQREFLLNACQAAKIMLSISDPIYKDKSLIIEQTLAKEIHNILRDAIARANRAKKPAGE